MPTAKQLLLKQTAEAFSGRSDMPLMASLADITQAEASWCPDKESPSAEQIVRHVAWAKARYCQQAFGTEMPIVDESVNGDGDSTDLPWEFPCGAAWGSSAAPGIHEAIKLLTQSHAILTQCLESLSDDAPSHPSRQIRRPFFLDHDHARRLPRRPNPHPPNGVAGKPAGVSNA